jgi:hypothetical protein
MLLMGAALGVLYGLSAVFPDIFGAWFDHGIGFAVGLLAVHDAKVVGLADDVVRPMARLMRHLPLDRMGVRNLAGYIRHLRLLRGSVDELGDALDNMATVKGFRGPLNRLVRAIEDGRFVDADASVAEIRHAWHLRKSRGLTIEEMSRTVDDPLKRGHPITEFDFVGRDASGRFVGETKNLRRSSLDIMNIEDWLADHVTDKMGDYRRALDSLSGSDPLYGVNRVKYTISEEVFDDPSFHGGFLDAIGRARGNFDLDIEVIPVPP